MRKREMQRAVKRGAKLLDKEMPGWTESIQLTLLDMRVGVQYTRNNCGCVGAQIAFATIGHDTSWVDTMKKLFGTIIYHEAERNGFTAYDQLTSGGKQEWKYLTELWKEEVRIRRAA